MNNQSNVIAAALVIAFIVYVTTRGSLAVYLSVLFGTASTSGANTAEKTTSSATSTASTVLGLGTNLKGMLQTDQQDVQSIMSWFR